MIKMIETDKSREVVRRGATRFSRQIKQSAHNLFSGLKDVGSANFVSFDKSKKERIKKLSAVNRATDSSVEHKCEMGCRVTDGGDALPSHTPPSVTTSSKRFKLPREQFLDDCNGVDHASVPRKMRSAMKKRNHKFVSPSSPDSKNLNLTSGGVESLKSGGLKKMKLDRTQGDQNMSPKHSTCGTITKDEEEVAETLYAMAGMFSENEPISNVKLESNENLLACPEVAESSQPAMEGVAIKEDSNSISLSNIDEAVPLASKINTSPEEVKSLNEPIAQEPVKLASSAKLYGELGSSIAQFHIHAALDKPEEQKPLCNSVNFCFASEAGSHTTSSLKKPTSLESSLLNRRPEIALGLSTSIGTQVEQQPRINESKTIGLSSVSSGACSHAPPSQSSAAKPPSWLDAALCATRSGALQTGPLTGKVCKVNTDRRSWKRSAAHVYISRLIEVLKVSECKDSSQLQPFELRPHDMLTQGVLLSANDFSGIKNGLRGVTYATARNNNYQHSSNKASNYDFQHQRLRQNIAQDAASSEPYISQKQNVNFFSLTAGGGSADGKNNIDGVGNCLEPPAQLQVPVIHHGQHPALNPFFLSRKKQSSSTFPDQPSVAAQKAPLHPAPTYGSTPFGKHASPVPLRKQQVQHLQQRLWLAHLPDQYRTSGTSTIMTQFPNWANGRQDPPCTLIPSTQPLMPPPPPSLELLSHDYPPISHHQLMTITSSMPHTTVKRPPYPLSSVYEETGSGFQTGGALPLQLLCDERL